MSDEAAHTLLFVVAGWFLATVSIVAYPFIMDLVDDWRYRRK